MRACVEQVHHNRPGALLRRNPEFLHQVRVGLRRLRVVLLAFRGLARRRRAEQLERRLARVLRRLGPARDWDVMLERMPGFNAKARALHERAWRRAHSRLASAGFLRLLDEVLAWSQSRPWRGRAGPGEPAAAYGVAVLREFRRALDKAAEGADWSSERERHRIRIRAKRLRYAADCFAAEENASLAPVLRPLQQALGDLRDLSVQRKLLREAGMPVRKQGKRRRALVRRVKLAWARYEEATKPAARG